MEVSKLHKVIYKSLLKGKFSEEDFQFMEHRLKLNYLMPVLLIVSQWAKYFECRINKNALLQTVFVGFIDCVMIYLCLFVVQTAERKVW